MKKNKTLLIGWDGADWKFLMPLIDQGLMPNLEKLIDGGVMGRLTTLDPPLSPTLWTSIATGKRPYKHGIHGFTEPTEDGKGVRPVYITSRKCKAIWNILNQHHLKSHVVGWWPSHPAEPINGTIISNLYHRSNDDINEDWHLVKGAVHPKEKEEVFKALRVHKQELTGNHIDPFVPRLAEIDQTQDKRPGVLAELVSECASIHSAATYIMDNEDWDFMAVYYDGIDHFGHGFMKYHPPHRPHIPLKDYELYKDVINGACRYHDMMLGTLMDLAGEDTNIILISDHGFHPNANRPTAIPKEPMGPAAEHSPYGIIVMKGEGIKKDEHIFGASLLDITPTILNLYDLPVAEDMDGKVLVQAFEEAPDIKTIKSWENIKGEDGRHPEDFKVEQEDAEEEMKQLIDLGYIQDYGDDAEKAVKGTIRENEYILAQAYLDGQQWEEGIGLLEKLHKGNPEIYRFAARLLYAYLSVNKMKEARKTADTIKEHFPMAGAQMDLQEGILLMHEGKPKAALECFEKVESQVGKVKKLHLRMGHALLNMAEYDKAERAARKELALDPEEVSAHMLLGQIQFKRGEYEGALSSLMDVVGLMYYFPAAHFHIGECLLELKQYEAAIKAYEIVLKMVPEMNQARQRIIHIYTNLLHQPGKAAKYRTDFQDNIIGTINIVSGLPRSGTSLMMQMLEAGGLEIFTDKNREADENNPKGYYEHEGVKSLKKNKQFLADAKGKTVKVIAHLLEHLPSVFRYRIVFMERDMMEIVQSQQRMLVRDEKRVSMETVPLKLMDKYKASLDKAYRWMENQPNVEFIKVSYKEVMESPFMQAMLVNDFFDGALTVEKMARIPDPTLYREQVG